MTRFTKKEFPFPDSRSAQELATAIWNYEFLPERDFTTVNGKRIHCAAKKFEGVSLDAGSQPVREFRHALFTLIQNRSEALTRRGIENAPHALDELAMIYDQHATESRKRTEVEFMDSPNGLVDRHRAEITADINDAENFSIIAGKLRCDKELHKLIHALAKKLDITLTPKERGV